MLCADALREIIAARGGWKESNVSAWFGTVGVEGWLRYRGRVTSSWEGSDEKAKLKTVTTSCTEKGTVFFVHTLMYSSSNGHSAISCPQIVRSYFYFLFHLSGFFQIELIPRCCVHFDTTPW